MYHSNSELTLISNTIIRPSQNQEGLDLIFLTAKYIFNLTGKGGNQMHQEATFTACTYCIPRYESL